MSEGARLRRNLIVFGCGPKGSGKTHFLWHRFTKHMPRVITLDSTGETKELYNPNVIETFGIADLRRALAYCVKRGRKWHIAAALDGPDELAELITILAPPYGSRLPSFSRGCGGVTLESSEVDEWMPNRGAPAEVLGAIRRGRHHLLNLLTATRRPSECTRELTSNADVIFSFTHREPAEQEYLSRAIGRAVADRIAALPKHHVAYFDKATQLVYFCDEKRKPYQVTDVAGAEWRQRGSA